MLAFLTSRTLLLINLGKTLAKVHFFLSLDDEIILIQVHAPPKASWNWVIQLHNIWKKVLMMKYEKFVGILTSLLAKTPEIDHRSEKIDEIVNKIVHMK